MNKYKIAEGVLAALKIGATIAPMVAVCSAPVAFLVLPNAALAGGLEPKRGGETRDLPIPAIQSTDDYSWTGLWIGAFGGYGVTLNDTLASHRDEGEIKGPTASGESFGGEGAFGNLQIGFDKQLGDRVVAGVFGGAQLGTAEGEFRFNKDRYTSEEQESYFVGGRVGILANAHNLFYVAGGYTRGTAEISWDNGQIAPNHKSENYDLDMDGWFGEAGVEARLDSNLYGRLAARYTSFDSQTVKGNFTDGGDCWDQLDIDPSKFEIMAGISYKFGMPKVGF